jgi:hypothetical protein
MFRTTRLVAAGAATAMLSLGTVACGGGGGNDNNGAGAAFNGAVGGVVNASDKTGAR